MNFTDFIPALGYPSDHPLVRSLITQAGSQKQPKLKKGDTDAYVEIPEMGLYLVFTDERAADFDLPTGELDEGTLVLKNATARNGSQNGYSCFPGTLPEGLVFNLTRDQVHQLLGAPSAINSFLPIEFYHRPGHRLICKYSDAEGQITSISVEPYRKD